MRDSFDYAALLQSQKREVRMPKLIESPKIFRGEKIESAKPRFSLDKLITDQAQALILQSGWTESAPLANTELEEFGDKLRFFINPQTDENNEFRLLVSFMSDEPLSPATLRSLRFEGTVQNFSQEFTSVILNLTSETAFHRILTVPQGRAACFTFLGRKFEIGAGGLID